MKKMATLALAALMAAVAHSANMASQKWVEMKLKELGAYGVLTNETTKALIEQMVAEAVSNSLAITEAISPIMADAGTNGTFYAYFEPASVAALAVTNSANATITNGTLFAWAGNGVYTNAPLNSAVSATQTNFVWNAIQSSVVDGVDTFGGPNGFSVTGLYITPTQAAAIQGE